MKQLTILTNQNHFLEDMTYRTATTHALAWAFKGTTWGLAHTLPMGMQFARDFNAQPVQTLGNMQC